MPPALLVRHTPQQGGGLLTQLLRPGQHSRASDTCPCSGQRRVCTSRRAETQSVPPSLLGTRPAADGGLRDWPRRRRLSCCWPPACPPPLRRARAAGEIPGRGEQRGEDSLQGCWLLAGEPERCVTAANVCGRPTSGTTCAMGCPLGRPAQRGGVRAAENLAAGEPLAPCKHARPQRPLG